MKRSKAVLVAHVHEGVVLEQQFDDILVSQFRGDVQGGLSALLVMKEKQ